VAQHDYVIANGTGAAVRSDLNNGLAAIVSQNSGTTEPATMYAYQWWADTTTGLLKIRNAANNAWVTVGTLASANLGLLSSGSTVTAALGSASTPGITFTGDLNTGIYSPGADQVAISTNGTGRLFVDSSGRVLVGTSSARTNIPGGGQGVLIEGSSSTNDQNRFTTHVFGENSTSGPYVGLAKTRSASIGGNTIVQSGDFLGGLYFHGADGTTFVPAANIVAQVDGTPGSNDMPGRLVFSTTADSASSPTERMRIDSSGRVGIGTTSPSAALHVAAANNSQVFIAATDANPTTIIIDTDAGSSERVRINNKDGALTFDTSNSSERARIDASGRLLVGTSTSLLSSAYIQSYRASGDNLLSIDSDSLADNQSAAIRVAGGARVVELGVYKHSGITNPSGYIDLVQEDGTSTYYWTDNSDQFRLSNTAAHIGTTSGTVVGTQTSDGRLKNILGPVTYGLDTLKQIEPVRYSLKSQPDIEQLGFIAQQVQPLIPQSVFDTKEHIEGEPEDAPTKLGMEYVALIPVLVNAIKELSAEVDALKAQLS
jgi:hypothetical protein